MLLPFSRRGKEWEPKALGLRRIAGVKSSDTLDPWELAPKVGLLVVNGDVATAQLTPRERSLLCGPGKHRWSGGVFPQALPDGKRICILNSGHSYRRNKVTLMEEICHLHLGHQPTVVLLNSHGVKVRDYDKDQEQEAYGIGAAALIPWSTFFPLLNIGASTEDLAEKYDVTRNLIEYRIKITGAYRLYMSRQKR